MRRREKTEFDTKDNRENGRAIGEIEEGGNEGEREEWEKKA